MSWLKRLLGSSLSEAENARPSPPPPAAPATADEPERIEEDDFDASVPLPGDVRRPRVKLLPLHEISFQPQGGEPLHLANLSLGGLGILRDPRVATHPQAGARLRGVLQLQERRFELELDVVHLTERIIGCSYVNPDAAMLKELEHYFEVEFSSLTLLEINPAMLKAEDDGKPHCFHGRNHCELNFVESEGHIVRFDLSFFGHYVEGGEKLTTYFGELEHEHPGDKMKYKGSTLVRKKAAATQDLIDLAVRFVSNAPRLRPEFRDTIIGMIHRAKVLP